MTHTCQTLYNNKNIVFYRVQHYFVNKIIDNSTTQYKESNNEIYIKVNGLDIYILKT